MVMIGSYQAGGREEEVEPLSLSSVLWADSAKKLVGNSNSQAPF